MVPFVDAGDGLLGALVDSLDTPGCREFMLGGIPHEMVFVRRERDRRQQTVHTVVLLDGAPVGWCGWKRFELDSELVETTTFLAESVWGAGVNAELNHLKWQVAAAAGRKLIFSVNERNGRSLSALRKAWPALTETRMWEQGVARFSNVGDP